MMEITAFQRAYARDQIPQRTGESVGKKKYKSAADQDRYKTQQEQVTVELIDEPGSLIVRSEHNQANRSGLFARECKRSREKVYFAHPDVARITLERASNQIAHTRALHLSRIQCCGHNLITVRECHLTGCDFAHLAGQPIIDLVTNHQEAEKVAFRVGASVNGLHESLVKMMRAKPPMAGIVFVERLLEIVLCGVAREAGGLRVHRDHFLFALHQHEQ